MTFSVVAVIIISISWAGDGVEDAFVATASQVLDKIKSGVFNLNDEVGIFLLTESYFILSVVSLVAWY